MGLIDLASNKWLDEGGDGKRLHLFLTMNV